MDVCTLPLRTGSMMDSLGKDSVSLVFLVGELSQAQAWLGLEKMGSYREVCG